MLYFHIHGSLLERHIDLNTSVGGSFTVKPWAVFEYSTSVVFHTSSY